jgi:hypothetical protein
VSAVRAALVVALAVLAVAAAPGRAGAANECNGIPRCIPVAGPWVAVPAVGEADFVLGCPQGRGIVAGTDALASSTDVRATFDGIIGSPIAFGRTTNTAVLFRAVSAQHRAGSFRPFVGCIPAPSSVRNTISTEVTPLGAALTFVDRILPVHPGFERLVTLSCPTGETLVDSWSATAFASARPPLPALATAISVHARISGGRAQLLVTASETLPRGTGAEVQLGVRCAP